MKSHQIANLNLKRHYRKQHKRYNCKIPGERIQMDVCKIAKSLYQDTAIDDCTRYKVLALYSTRTAANSVDFINQVILRMPFPLQRIQTDRGQEFCAYLVQDRLRELKVKFRPIKPFSPHLNGKVERSQRTDLDEFYSSIDPSADTELYSKLKTWENYYNTLRPHSSLANKTPLEKYQQLQHLIPIVENLHMIYDSSKEHFISQNYKNDLIIKILKNEKSQKSLLNLTTSR